MKITRTAEEAKIKREYKDKEKDIELCPCCGAMHTCSTRVDHIWEKGFEVECYKCDNCGAEWQSEPYERFDIIDFLEECAKNNPIELTKEEAEAAIDFIKKYDWTPDWAKNLKRLNYE